MLKKTKNKVILAVTTVLVIWFYFILPSELFNASYSTVLFDRNNELLSATISEDGQWRFKNSGAKSDKFRTAIIHFEDQYFYRHFGVNPVSLVRAVIQNIKAGEIISGGSTLSMQVIRLSRRKRRTVWEKTKEVILATRLEFRYSKESILDLYSTHAPFGGNVVGIEAASWRYFARKPDQLSWGEACLLAVLPNNPSMIHPGKNREQLRFKRDRLINKLLQNDIIDSLTASLAKSENIPEKPTPLPQVGRHLLQRVQESHIGDIFNSTIDYDLQNQVSEILKRSYQNLSANQVHNVAALVANVKTGAVHAYVGNVNSGPDHGEYVDIINSRRSTGSILKPFLYSAMIDEGMLMPEELVSDKPTYIDGFNPSNFSGDFDGMVPANAALFRSLNVPAVQMLRKYRYQKFHSLLKELGMTTLDQPADHYGLSIILGGAEASMWDITRMYMHMASSLSSVVPERVSKLHYDIESDNNLVGGYKLSRGALWHTLDALTEVTRPIEEGNWKAFASSSRIAWKTGTSFGHRDAWAVGVTPEWVVTVWAGNADGEGRPGLTGIRAAAPILFDIYSALESEGWFLPPSDELVTVNVCVKSGHKASKNCPEVEIQEVFKRLERKTACPYHKIIHLDKMQSRRVTSECYQTSAMVTKSWFVLPPTEEFYYAKKHPEYQRLPEAMGGCKSDNAIEMMDFIYPDAGSKIYLPKEIDGKKGKLILEVAHRKENETIYWHIDDNYKGLTRGNHAFAVQPLPGIRKITLVDGAGNTLTRNINFVDL